MTLLAGASSSGKSTLMQAILLLKQTLESPYDPGPLLLNGPNVKFTSIEQLLHVGTNGTQSSREFTIGFKSGETAGFESRFGVAKKTGNLTLLSYQLIHGRGYDVITSEMSGAELAQCVARLFRSPGGFAGGATSFARGSVTAAR